MLSLGPKWLQGEAGENAMMLRRWGVVRQSCQLESLGIFRRNLISWCAKTRCQHTRAAILQHYCLLTVISDILTAFDAILTFVSRYCFLLLRFACLVLLCEDIGCFSKFCMCCDCL